MLLVNFMARILGSFPSCNGDFATAQRGQSEIPILFRLPSSTATLLYITQRN